jgi:hypothetical protein
MQIKATKIHARNTHVASSKADEAAELVSTIFKNRAL